jgi:hypothetical protein
MREAIERSARRGSVAVFGPDGDPEADGEPIESVLRVWLAPPDRAREEREGADGEGFGVRRGPSWWHYDPHNGAMSNADDPEVGSGIGQEVWWLLDPAPPIGFLDFDTITPGRQAERPTLRVRAVPRPLAEGEAWPLFRLGADGADELLLDVDAERGALLRIEARFHGQPLFASEVTEIAFDETFTDDVFEFTPPPGEQVRSITDQFAIERDLTVEEAVARAPFTVWIPSRVPAEWETRIAFAAENDRPPMAPPSTCTIARRTARTRSASPSHRPTTRASTATTSTHDPTRGWRSSAVADECRSANRPRAGSPPRCGWSLTARAFTSIPAT